MLTGNFTQDKYYLDPTISRASRHTGRAGGALTGWSDRSDDLRVRPIPGTPF